MERDYLCNEGARAEIISTHTLTWSVTSAGKTPSIVVEISTHTLTWSVTPPFSNGDKHLLNFNSHAHVERDFVSLIKLSDLSNFNSHAHVERDIIECALKFYNDISTHTLTWSVT